MNRELHVVTLLPRWSGFSDLKEWGGQKGDFYTLRHVNLQGNFLFKKKKKSFLNVTTQIRPKVAAVLLLVLMIFIEFKITFKKKKKRGKKKQPVDSVHSLDYVINSVACCVPYLPILGE